MSVFDRFREEEDPIAEKIEKNSITIAVLSAMSESGGMINSANILGGEGIIEDEETRSLAEVGFGQINIVDLFEMRQYVLHTIKYGSELVHPAPRELGSYIYQVKAHAGNVFYLGLLITPYSDINLTKYERYVDMTCKYYWGSYRRSEMMRSVTDVDVESDYQDADDTATDLLTLQHHLIFNRRELRGGVETIRKPTAIFMVVLSEFEIGEQYYQCKRDGCKIELKKDELVDGKCPKCQSEVATVPPNPMMKRVAFVFPKGMFGVKHPDYERPMDMVSIVQLGLIPDTVLVAINQINPEIFSNIVYLPMTAFYEFRDSDDVFATHSVWRREGNKIYMATAMADSFGLVRDAVPHMEGRTILRDLTEGIEKGKRFEEIIPRTIIRDWLTTEWLNLKDLAEDPELQSYQGVLGISDEEVQAYLEEIGAAEEPSEGEEEATEKKKGRLSGLLSRRGGDQ